MKKEKIVLLMMGFSLLFSLILYGYTKKENKVYEEYFSELIATKIVNITEYSFFNRDTLNKITDEKKITKQDAEQLTVGFQSIAVNTQDIGQLGFKMDAFSDFNTSNIAKINMDYSEHFLKLEFSSNESKDLTDEELVQLLKMKEFMEIYTNILDEHFNVISYNGTQSDILFNYYAYEKGIKDGYWVELLRELENVTDNSYAR